jgi:hypothetical protein
VNTHKSGELNPIYKGRQSKHPNFGSYLLRATQAVDLVNVDSKCSIEELIDEELLLRYRWETYRYGCKAEPDLLSCSNSIEPGLIILVVNFPNIRGTGMIFLYIVDDSYCNTNVLVSAEVI